MKVLRFGVAMVIIGAALLTASPASAGRTNVQSAPSLTACSIVVAKPWIGTSGLYANVKASVYGCGNIQWVLWLYRDGQPMSSKRFAGDGTYYVPSVRCLGSGGFSHFWQGKLSEYGGAPYGYSEARLIC